MKPREWTVKRDNEDIEWLLTNTNAPDYYPIGKIALVEKSTFDELAAELEQVKNTLQAVSKNNLMNADKIAELRAENEKLKKEFHSTRIIPDTAVKISNLVERVRKALEFDEMETKDSAARRYEGLKHCGVHVITYQVEAARWDRARTAKLVEALLNLAEDICDGKWVNGVGEEQVEQRLENIIKEMERK